MKETDYQIVNRRLKALRAMDFIARHSNNETCIVWWLQNGIADGDAKWDDNLLYYAENRDVFRDMCEAFVTLMGCDEMQEDGLYFYDD